MQGHTGEARFLGYSRERLTLGFRVFDEWVRLFHERFVTLGVTLVNINL